MVAPVEGVSMTKQSQHHRNAANTWLARAVAHVGRVFASRRPELRDLVRDGYYAPTPPPPPWELRAGVRVTATEPIEDKRRREFLEKVWNCGPSRILDLRLEPLRYDQVRGGLSRDDYAAVLGEIARAFDRYEQDTTRYRRNWLVAAGAGVLALVLLRWAEPPRRTTFMR